MSAEQGGGVSVVDEQTDVTLDLDHWSSLVSLVLSAEHIPATANIALAFVDEVRIAALNDEYLGVSGPTDVLAFPIDLDGARHGSEDDPNRRDSVSGGPPLMLGDVLVCPAVAARHATERDQPIESEIALLVVHGSLHLLDYDHDRPNETATMQRREREILAMFDDNESVAKGR